MRAVSVVLVLVLASLGLVACGGKSKQQKAQDQVCAARSDISKQVNTLKGLTLSTATTSQISNSLQAIGNDLNKIKNAQKDLSSQRKKEVQAANQAFENSIKSIASTLGSTTSLSAAKSQLSAALQGLATSYQQTFAKISCG